MAPEFIIATQTKPEPHTVEFNELYSQKDSIIAMLLLWDCNSYYVNVTERYFIINGGRRVFFKDIFPETTKVLYARRNRMDVVLDDVKEKRQISYLLGLESGDVQRLVIVSGDGRFYAWQTTK